MNDLNKFCWLLTVTIILVWCVFALAILYSGGTVFAPAYPTHNPEVLSTWSNYDLRRLKFGLECNNYRMTMRNKIKNRPEWTTACKSIDDVETLRENIKNDAILNKINRKLLGE
jgi:hypothetical protein